MNIFDRLIFPLNATLIIISCVKLARDIDTLKPLAAKVIDLDSSSGRRQFKLEASIMSQLPAHKNLPKLSEKMGRCQSLIVSTSFVNWYEFFHFILQYIDGERRYTCRQVRLGFSSHYLNVAYF